MTSAPIPQAASAEEARAGPLVDVRRFVDDARFSPYQKMLLALCFITTFVDGFDTQAVAVAGPRLRAEMGLEPAQMGTLFAAAMAGGVVTAFAMAPVADRVGRRPLLIGAVLVSAVLSIGHALATNFEQLIALRLAAGVSLAIAVTVTYAYAAEIAPKRAAATAVMVASAGFGLGVAATGFLAGWLIPLQGWRAVFLWGGVATLVLGVALLAGLPESVRYLAQRDSQDPRIRRFLTRIDPKAPPPASARFFMDEERKLKASLADVLASGRALVAIPLWTSTFFMAFVIYVLMQWLPIFVTNGGGGAAHAGQAVGWFKLGGVAGGFLCAALIERMRSPYLILVTCLLAAAAAFAAMAATSAASGMFIIIVAVCGVLLNGPLYATNGLMGRLFPTYVRAAGLSITAGVGRAGAMTGPFVVGLLMQAGWTVPQVLRAAPAPVLIAMGILAMLSLRDRMVARQAQVA